MLMSILITTFVCIAMLALYVRTAREIRREEIQDSMNRRMQRFRAKLDGKNWVSA